jgi:S-DNA-T family DNA segregation ATPase FtsK/SpoIIIE
VPRHEASPEELEVTSLSVTEVRNALRCPRLFTLGRIEGRSVAFPVGTSSLGATFHRVVDNVAKTATTPPDELAQLAHGAELSHIERALRRWWLGVLAAELDACPTLTTMPAEVDDLAEALRQFARYVAGRLGASALAPAAALSRFFDKSELEVEATVEPPLGGAFARLTGRIDALHAPPGDRLEVVEYKLTSAENQRTDRAQVALYRWLLTLAKRLDAEPVILRFGPELQITRLAPGDADELVVGELIPLIVRMVEWAAEPDSAPATQQAELCPSCPLRVACTRAYADYLPSRDDPPAGAARPRPSAEGDIQAAEPEAPVAAVPSADPSEDEERLRFEEAFKEVLRELGVGARIQPPVVIGARLLRAEIIAVRGRVRRIDDAAEDVRHQLHQRGLNTFYERRGAQRLFFAERQHARQVLLAPLLVAEADWLKARPGRFVLGERLDGKPLCADLGASTSCHLLVAGATGSGKSVLLRAIASSLAHYHPPATLRFTLVDPKRVSLAPLRESLAAHLAQPPCFEAPEALALLEDLAGEMERRYAAFSALSVEDIEAFNETTTPAQRLARSVVIIDEFQDLMAVRASRQRFEDVVQRLGSKARAAGIHLVLATQHPTAKVLPTSIKANLTGRVALRVQDWRASKVILDAAGAEELLGSGDLYADLGAGLQRAQAPLA